MGLIVATPFVYSRGLYDGIISARQIWFYGTMGLLLLVAGLDILFSKKINAIRLNAIDIAWLVLPGRFTYKMLHAIILRTGNLLVDPFYFALATLK